MSNKKKIIRNSFRNAVFDRDNYCCVGCGLKVDKNESLQKLDAHHITPREEMPNGGYVKENGVTLCKNGCHEKAEYWLKNKMGDENFSPQRLYKKITRY